VKRQLCHGRGGGGPGLASTARRREPAPQGRREPRNGAIPCGNIYSQKHLEGFVIPPKTQRRVTGTGQKPRDGRVPRHEPMRERRTALPEPLASGAPAVRASGAIGLPLESRGRVVGVVVGFDPAPRPKNQEIDSPALTASVAALEPGAIALDKCTTSAGRAAIGHQRPESALQFTLPRAERCERAPTASVGMATLPDVSMSAGGLIHADSAMSFVKDRGKNGIHVAG